ncbi:MAG TPA: DHH family phosphoesterase [Candidatus Saccharimonadia bacterium]|nr:DHH family phosphoesterase [Candidatus Saccharimonadia bacterium]
MKLTKNIKQFKELLDTAKKVVIIQADNPDGDSLASSLALEQIIHDLKKEPFLYCAIEMPQYLRYLNGWDRVERDLPKEFDLSIIVDCSSIELLESAKKTDVLSKISKKPCVILDHHTSVKSNISFASVAINEPVASTGELIYEISELFKWHLAPNAISAIATSIMSDTLGLVSQSTSARTIHIIAELVEKGVSLTLLDEARRNVNRKSPELIKYKGRLLQRIEFFRDNSISIITIPWEEIVKYSYSYNPSVLVLDEMRLGEGNLVAIAFKSYQNGRITAKIRTNYGAPVADKLAKHFGGGGHEYSSGFKIDEKLRKDLESIKAETLKITSNLLDEIEKL